MRGFRSPMVASIDPDLPAAEMTDEQLRGVVGVHILRLRRQLDEAEAALDRRTAEVEASNHRHGELVAERAALRREFEAARVTNQLLTYGGRDEEGVPLTLTGRLFYAARRLSEAAERQDPPAAWTEEEARAVALHIEARDLLREAAACLLQAARPELAPGPPRSPFTPEQERAIGSLVGRVTVQPRGQPSRWEAFVDGVLDVPEVVFAASEQSAKNLACVVIARKRWPDLWPETA